MSIYNNKNAQTSHETQRVFPEETFAYDRPATGSKFNISMEKKIERLWHESKDLGWNFNAFVTHVMEILIVIQHRNKIPVKAAAPRKHRIKSNA
jgi:hypothetical protein